jgi:hypothetical protein
MTGEITGPTRQARSARRPELDVVRLLVVIGLVFFHSALVFDSRDDYYVKNAETTEVTTILAGLGVVRAMPMLFLVAGVGSWHSLRRRGAAGFAKERVRRLGVPLVFATLTIIPIPQYLRLKSTGSGYDESYLEFLPRFFDVDVEPADFPFLLDGEDFETGHLWFVVLLLVFSLMLALVAGSILWRRAGRSREWLALRARHRGAVLLPAIPVAVISALLGLEEGFAAWSRWAYLVFFLYGFVLASDERFRIAMRREAVLAATLGVAMFAVGMPVFLLVGESGGDPFTDMSLPAIGARILYGASGWLWLVGILGLLDRRRPARAGTAATRRSTGGRIYSYLSAAALPLYILHQPSWWGWPTAWWGGTRRSS